MKPGPILHWRSGLARWKYTIISSLLIKPSLGEREENKERDEDEQKKREYNHISILGVAVLQV